MNDEDLRKCFAMFILGGVLMRGDSIEPKDIWELADEMVEAGKPKEEGIVKIKRVKKP